MDTRTQDDIAKGNKTKVVPQAPQPTPEEAKPQTEVYAWTPRRNEEVEPFFLTGEEEDDEPAPDVGGEVGKTPRLLTAWQITGLVVGGLAIAAGIAVYMARSRRD